MGNCTNFCYTKEDGIVHGMKMDQIEQTLKERSESKKIVSGNQSYLKEKSLNNKEANKKNNVSNTEEKQKKDLIIKENDRQKIIGVNSPTNNNIKNNINNDKAKFYIGNNDSNSSSSSIPLNNTYSQNHIAETNDLVAATLGKDYRKELPSITLENGAIYSGQWKNGMRDGYGIQSWVDSSKYEGDWREDKANGFGKLIHADGDIYEGDWLNDKANGKGIYIHANGARYEGNYFKNKS